MSTSVWKLAVLSLAYVCVVASPASGRAAVAGEPLDPSFSKTVAMNTSANPAFELFAQSSSRLGELQSNGMLGERRLSGGLESDGVQGFGNSGIGSFEGRGLSGMEGRGFGSMTGSGLGSMTGSGLGAMTGSGLGTPGGRGLGTLFAPESSFDHELTPR